jgi:spermidine synthase
MPARPTPEPELVPATLSEADGVRYLHLGTPWVQGAMRVRKPNVIELDYVQRMMVWLLLIEPEALGEGHAVQLGLGAAAITRFTLRMGMRTTAVELNPTVITACRLWFRLPEDDDRLQVLNQDAGRWVADPQNAGSVQVLCVDLYDHEAASPVLDDDAFYRACHRVLADGGVMTVNLFGRDASYEQSAARIAAAFGEAAVWSMRPTREGNTVVLALRTPVAPRRGALAERAQTIQTRWSLPAPKWLRVFKPQT